MAVLVAAMAGAGTARAAADGSAPSTGYVVSPQGRDAWSGRLPAPNADRTDGPFATLERARDAMRGGGPKLTCLRGGDYFLTRTLELSAADRGITIQACPGERPVLHGGPRVAGWTRVADGVWTAKLDLPRGATMTDLHIGGVRQTPARYPNKPPGSGEAEGWLYADTPADGRDPSTHFRARSGDLPGGLTAKPGLKVSIFTENQWVSDVLDVKSINRIRGIVTTNGVDYLKYGAGSRYFFFGAAALLDAPGEWFHDRKAGVLRYKPLDEGFANRIVVAGTLETVFHVTSAQDITLKGLTIADTAPLGSGHAADRAHGGGAIRIENARNIQVLDNTLRNVGVGVHVGGGSAVRVAGNEVGWAAGNSMYLGMSGTGEPTTNSAVENNWLHDGGQVYKETAGIVYQGASDTRIAHNLIERMAQFGIHGGSVWGRQDASYRNIVEYNVVRDANLATADGGGIKLMGMQRDRSGDVIRHNEVTGTTALMNHPDGRYYDTKTYRPGQWPAPISYAIYLDWLASGVEVYGNVLKDNIGGVFIHSGTGNTVRGNLLVNNIGHQFVVNDSAPAEGHPRGHDNVFRGNIAYMPGRTAYVAELYEPFRNAGMASFDRNLYWGPALGQSFHAGPEQMASGYAGTLRDWQKAGYDVRSMVADPHFRSADSGDYRLLPDSPAFGLGFEAIPFDRIGLDAGTPGWRAVRAALGTASPCLADGGC